VFWHSKPSLDQVANAISRNFPGRTDEETLAIVNIWSGHVVRLGDIDYRIEQIAPTKLVENQ